MLCPAGGILVADGLQLDGVVLRFRHIYLPLETEPDDPDASATVYPVTVWDATRVGPALQQLTHAARTAASAPPPPEGAP